MQNPPATLIQKTPSGLVPYGQFSALTIEEMVNGQVMTAKKRKDRRVPANGRYWIGLQAAVDNCEAWATREQLHNDLKRLCGYVDLYHNPLTGQDEVRVQSTAFDKMDESDFRHYWREAQRKFSEKMGFDPWSISA